MSTATVRLNNSELSNPKMESSSRHTAIIYLKEAKYEFLKNLRLRMYTASVLSFPIMFYVLFGLVLNSKEAIGGTRVPPFAYFTAKVVTSMIFSAIIVLALFTLGFALGGVRLPLPEAGRLLGTLVMGSLPFSALGLALGYFTGPNSALNAWRQR